MVRPPPLVRLLDPLPRRPLPPPPEELEQIMAEPQHSLIPGGKAQIVKGPIREGKRDDGFLLRDVEVDADGVGEPRPDPPVQPGL